MEASVAALLIAIVLSHSLGADVKTCPSPQYLEVGKTQTIRCFFQVGFYAVAWYDSNEFTESKSRIRVVNDLKQGDGYSSGEFDILMDGSLVINNVTLHHDHRFTVLLFQSQDEDPVSLVVEVIVTVKPLVNFPMINQCEEKPVCFAQLSPGSNVTCFVRDVRPAVSLTWAARIAGRDKEVSFDTTVMNNNTTFTSSATTSSAFLYSSLLSLLVCKGDISNTTLLHRESVIFVENSNIDLSNVDPVKMYVERGSQLKLSCLQTNASLIVWKKTKQFGGVFRILSYAAPLEANVSKIYSDDYVLQSDGSLKLSETETKHDGLYSCVFENENARGIALYNVVIFVVAHPTVHGCTLKQYCVLAMQLEGTLTCSVTGIRPKMQLEWRTLDDRDSSFIMFTDQATTTITNGETYDVQITSKYRIQQTSRNRLTLECRILGQNITAFSSTAKFDLLINNVQPTINQPTVKQPTNDVVPAEKNPFAWLLIALVIPLILLIFLMYRRVYSKEEQTKKTRLMKNRYESIPVPMAELTVNGSYPGKQDVLISQLKTKYQDLYEAVQPIPYIRDRLCCVDMVFVESGIEYLVAKERICGRGTWSKLASHHSIFHDPQVQSMRRIIEGEPGYGKSTLSLQLAYDWCNEIRDSYMKKVDILILLRLRQFRGVKSIFSAIKHFLLPKDTMLTERDVKNIVLGSTSVVVVLDGFDEYPDRDGDTNSDVLNIIEREMFQNFEVILTTRSSCLPNKYPALTKRIKLTGFDDSTQDKYIRKAVARDDDRAAKKIKQQLKENPILKDLCEVPLFFAMFAHMSHESEIFQKCNSVTSFFRHIISCLHSHMKNKLKDKNVAQYNVHENEHKKLDKVAFDGLCSKGQQIVWKKEDLRERLGQDFYDQYVRIGILVEEEVLAICHTSSSQIPGDIQYQTDVQFYHKIFCEWFAAHCVADYASKGHVDVEHSKRNNSTEGIAENENDHYLKNLDPFDLQYTYRFACGLNPNASKQIVGYLRSTKETDKFATLCILEQPENGLQDVEDLCSRDVILNANDSLLLQRSTVQLLKIASNNKISIASVCLTECYRTFDLSSGNLHLKTDFTIPVLTTLRKLDIWETGRELSLENICGALKYALICSALEELWFFHCLLPRSIPAESLSDLKPIHAEGKIRPFDVFWGTGLNTYYCLNLETGFWQRPPQFGSAVISDEDYKRALENV